MNDRSIPSKKTISPRQLAFILLICTCAFRIIIVPSLIAQKANQDAWLSFLITTIVALLMIFLVLQIVEKNKGKNFKLILEECFGKFLSKIFLVFIAMFFIFKIVITDFGMESFLFESLYDKINWPTFIVPIFFVMSYMSFKGPRVIGRVAEIFMVFGLISLFFSTIVALPDIKLENILPIGANGFVPILEGAKTGFTLGGECIFLLIFCENLETKKAYNKKCFKYALFILTFLCFFMFAFISIFGNISSYIKDALTKLSLFSQVTNTTSRLDSIIISLWLPMIIIYSSLNIYCASWCIKNVLEVKKFVPCILIVLSFVLISKLIPQVSAESLSYVSLNYFAYISIFLQIFLPLLLWIILLIKNKKRRLKLAKLKE